MQNWRIIAAGAIVEHRSDDVWVMGKAIPVVQVGVVRFLFSRVRRSGIDPFQTFVASPHMTALDRQQTFQSAVIIGAAMRP